MAVHACGRRTKLKSPSNDVILANNEQDRLAATGAWSKEQVSWLTTTAKQEARDVSLKLYIELLVQVSPRWSNIDLQYQIRCLGSQKVMPPCSAMNWLKYMGQRADNNAKGIQRG